MDYDNNDQPIDVEPEPHALVKVPDAPLAVTLFDRNPATAMHEMGALVTMMSDLVTSLPAKVQKKYIATIQGRPYPCVTWWTTIAMPLQLVPQIAWTRRIDTEPLSGYDHETWLARCEVVHTPSGNIIATGEGLCSGAEMDRNKPKWTDHHAIQAMSQTRAIGRTFRQCLAGLAVMAGLEATPAEEMTDKMRRGASRPPAKAQAPPRDDADEPAAHILEQHVGKRVEGTVATIQPEDIWKPHGNRKSKWFSCEGRDVRLCTYSNPESADEAKRWGVGMVVNFKVDEIGHFPDGNDKAMVSEVRPGRLPLDDAESIGEPSDEPREPSVSSDDGSCGYCGASAHETCKDDCTAPTPF